MSDHGSMFSNILQTCVAAGLVAAGTYLVQLPAQMHDMQNAQSNIQHTLDSHTDQFKDLKTDHDEHVQERIKLANDTDQLNKKVDWLHDGLNKLSKAVDDMAQRLDGDEKRFTPHEP
jgi:septal ring factor EnvC (AmiA/AmiB activator)